jgi:hypothetical protein
MHGQCSPINMPKLGKLQHALNEKPEAAETRRKLTEGNEGN